MFEEVPRASEVGSTFIPATRDPEQVESLTRMLSEQLLDAFGVGRRWPGRRLLRCIPRIPARRLARQVAVYDRIVGEVGLKAGGAWALERMARDSGVEGRERVPREGPLLVVSNHPGLADTVALFASLPRTDLRVVATQNPFLEVLPNTSRYLIPVFATAAGRLGPVRAASRHLKGGGAVLTFPGGRIEPDPAVLPGAEDSLSGWSESVELFARLVPGLIIIPVAVSGVLSKKALSLPVSRLRREKSDREWLAASIQMLVPALRDVSTLVTFGEPIRTGQPPHESSVSRAVVEEMRRLISHHGKGALQS